MDIKSIFSNNQKWIRRKLRKNGEYFKELSKGQEPEILYIGCSDSRVSAEDLMGVQPGEVFVHRNIANLVVSTDNNLNAVVQYAVEHLKVKHIIVCGHYECGGVKAALNPSDLGQLNSWLQTLRDVYNGSAAAWSYRAWVMVGLDLGQKRINHWQAPPEPRRSQLTSWGHAGSLHGDAIYVLMADGSAHYLSDSTDEVVLERLAAMSDDHIVELP